MKRFLCIGGRGAGGDSGELWKSAQTFSESRKLKIVRVGPMLSVYLDGELQTRQRIVATEGCVGFYAHGGGEGIYEWLYVSTQVDPKDALASEIVAPGNALVFAPDAPVTLTCRLSNYSTTTATVTVTAAVNSWDDQVIREKAERHVMFSPGILEVIEFPLGKIPAGFYRLALRADCGDANISEMSRVPLAIQKGGDVEFTPPVIPVAAYSKYFNERTPLYLNTYTHAIARILRERHLNAIVADPSFTAETVEIFRRYGVATIARSGKFMEFPSVIATLQRGEPKPDEIEVLKAEYAKVESAGKAATTCLVGEGMGLGGDHDPVNIWKKLEPRLRAYRWYGVKKSFYSPPYEVRYKGWLPLSSVLRITEASSDTPWWFISPSFGRDDHEAYYMNPTPAEMRSMMHLAMAHGADGLMLWCLQSWLQSRSEWIALIHQQSLKPTDGKLAAAGQVAALIEKHAELLSALRYGAFEVRNSNPTQIEAVPRRTAAGRGYIYVVNEDAGPRATARLAFKGVGAVRDLFSGKELPVTPSPRSVELTLEPGGATLLDVGEMAVEPRLVVAATGSLTLDSAVAGKISKDGVTVLRASLPNVPCVPGDAIGLSRTDDPRNLWATMTSGTRCFSWSGLLDARTAEGYLPLASALRVAEAYSTNDTFWTVFPAVATSQPTPGQLRAMVHLALAYGSQAVVLPETLPAGLVAVADEVAQIASDHGKVIAALALGGLDVRCKNPGIAAIPRTDQKDSRYVYAVNLDPANPATGQLLLWAETWTWAKARDVFAGRDLTVSGPDKEGYLSCTITLGPGEGRLIATDAQMISKKAN